MNVPLIREPTCVNSLYPMGMSVPLEEPAGKAFILNPYCNV